MSRPAETERHVRPTAARSPASLTPATRPIIVNAIQYEINNQGRIFRPPITDFVENCIVVGENVRRFAAVLHVSGRRYLAAPAETGLSAGVPQESGQAVTYFVENAA